jgi:GNAT superfamily N-acetyltransferase
MRNDCIPLLAVIREHAAFERSDATIDMEMLMNLLSIQTPQVRIFVAEIDGDVLAYAALTMDYSLWRGQTWAHLDCLYVRSSVRGSGIGGKLLQQATIAARLLGADRLEWQTPEWNQRAIAFYRREGASALTKVRFMIDLACSTS